MIGHKLPNKTKSATVAEPKLFHQLNNPYMGSLSSDLVLSAQRGPIPQPVLYMSTGLAEEDSRSQLATCESISYLSEHLQQ
jgi:hypothetical protein